MMSTKKIILLSLFSLIFCLFNAQVGNKTATKETIDSEIQKNRLVCINNPNKCIDLFTEIYQTCKKIDYKKGMLECDNILMGKFYDIGNFRKVVDISKEAEELAKEAGDNAILSNTYRLRAASYTELGFNDECLKELKKALNTVEKIPSKNGENYQKALIYIALSTYSAHVNAPIDSVVYYQKKCLESALLIDDHKDFINKKYYTLALSYINLGMTSVALKKAKDAETYFSKALEITENKKYIINGDFQVTILNEFAWLYYDQKDYQKAKSFAQQAEQAEKKIGLPYIRRDIYEVYFKSCVELGEKEVSKKYMNLYTKLNDSIVNVEKKSINTPVKYIIDEKEEVHTNDIKKIIMTASAMIIIILLCGWFFWRLNQRRIHDKYMNVIKNIEDEAGKREAETDEIVLSHTENKIQESGMNISRDTTTSILHKLSKFEKSERYLKKDVSLPSLAGSLNTNTRYLSELIKQHRGKNFNNYINGLRIQYITNKLYTDPVFCEYKISYLAEYTGFSSREVFAVIFKKETGVSPSYFIGQLKKENISKDSNKV